MEKKQKEEEDKRMKEENELKEQHKKVVIINSQNFPFVLSTVVKYFALSTKFKTIIIFHFITLLNSILLKVKVVLEINN